ncbi:MAG: hypothetical protein M1831_006886 [Alyxoria varia]|nr:MAG: hypothetical protein M1831_006886 [Alyxoria varia]
MELPKMQSRYPVELENGRRFTPANLRRSPESPPSLEPSAPHPDHSTNDRSPLSLPRVLDSRTADQNSKPQCFKLPSINQLICVNDEPLLTPPNSGELPKNDDFRGSPQRADSSDNPLFSAHSSMDDRYPLFYGEAAGSRRSTAFNLGPVRHSPDHLAHHAQSAPMERSASHPERSAYRNRLQFSSISHPAESIEASSRKSSRKEPARSDSRREKHISRHLTTTKSMFKDAGVQSPGEADYMLVAEFSSKMHNANFFAPPMDREHGARQGYPPRPASEERSPRLGRYPAYSRECGTSPRHVRRGISEVSVINGQHYGPIMPPKRRESSYDQYAMSRYPDATPARSPGPSRKRARNDSSSVEPEFSNSRKRRSPTDQSQGPSRQRRNGTSPLLNKDGRHARNRSTKEKKSANYSDYEDWAPSWETMHEPIKRGLEVKTLDVKNPVDLKNDPLRAELHQSEIIVSTRLNLNCETYLLVKRQMFTRFKQYLEKHDGNWNKTAAQKASNLDVGKVSALFVFFQNVGWFNADLYEGKVDIDPASASACSASRKTQPVGQE